MSRSALNSCFHIIHTEPRHGLITNTITSPKHTLSTGKMKPRCLFPLCLLLPAVCGGDGSSAATTVRRRQEAQQTQNGKNDLRRQREVSDHSSDIKRFGRSLLSTNRYYTWPLYTMHLAYSTHMYTLSSRSLPASLFVFPMSVGSTKETRSRSCDGSQEEHRGSSNRKRE